MARTQTPKEKLNITLPSRLKRRLSDIAQDKGLSMNDIAIHALKDYLDRADGTYQNADLVVDRLTQVLNSQITVIQQLQYLNKSVQDLER